ncbi:MAG: protease inhibitor I42 family protein [Clostridia bacterium]|nr:protease inhibitor I42 family protein [Clostridia bacterium]
MRGKVFKHAIAGILCAVLLFSTASYATAGNIHNRFIEKAETLYKLGLYKGISQNEFNPDLDALADRKTAIIMALRLMGKEKAVLELEASEVNKWTEKFKDLKNSPHWVKKYIAYAVKTGALKGFPDGTIRPDAKISGKQYLALILRQLGYSFKKNEEFNIFKDTASLPLNEMEDYNTDLPISKGLLVYISYRTLDAHSSDYRINSVIGLLIDCGVVKKHWESGDYNKANIMLESGIKENLCKVNEFASVRLFENKSTGYQWKFSISDPEILVLDSEGSVQPITSLLEGHNLGVGGEHIWNFRALKAGNCKLVFEYYRPWSSEGSAIDTKEYNISITLN